MIEFMESKEEWEKFWYWLTENFKNYEVIPENSDTTETIMFKKFLKICLYDWIHYKRTNHEFMTVCGEQRQ